ncbi:MAG: hypothetical protein MUC29_02880 [Pyrinomonadaceae bacterium]|nr:hypothetical protein [Pyrinomonadaceae bacterium]
MKTSTIYTPPKSANKFVIHFAGHGSYGHIGIIDNSSKEKSTFGDKPRYALLIGIDDYKYKKLSLNDTTDWKESAKTFSQNKIESAVIWENRDYSMGNLSNRSFLSLINPYNTGFEDVKRYFSIPIKSYAINVNDKSPTSLNWQFWLLLFNGIMNAIASISAIILAWVSNNRAKAEFLLKQAKDERDKLELELKIKTTELEILKSQKELDIKIPTILVTN